MSRKHKYFSQHPCRQRGSVLFPSRLSEFVNVSNTFFVFKFNKKLPERLWKHHLHGKGKETTEAWWKAFGRLLMTEKYLQERLMPSYPGQQQIGFLVEMTEKSKYWLSLAQRTKNASLKLMPTNELAALERSKMTIAELSKKILPTVARNKWISTETLQEQGLLRGLTQKVDPIENTLKVELYSGLMVLRNELANDEGVAPYMVLSNKNLLDIAEHRPTSLASLAKVDGIPEARINKFGLKMVQFVATFCKDNALRTETFPEENNIEKAYPKVVPLMKELTITQRETYLMFEQQNKSLSETAAERSLAPTTIVNHLCEAIKVGLPVSLKKLGVTPAIHELVVTAIRDPPINSDIGRLSAIKDQLPLHVEFNHIKVVIAILQSQYGVTEYSVNLPTGQSQVGPPLKANEDSEQIASTSLADSGTNEAIKRKLPTWASKAPSTAIPKKVKKKNSIFS